MGLALHQYIIRIFALPDGKVFMAANNRSIIYDIENNTETILPDIPNGVRVTNPTDGTAILLPLSPPDYVPEVLICGGSDIDDRTPVPNLSTQIPASSQCSRITLTPEGIARGWEIDHMLEGRTMHEFVHIPNGQLLLANGAGSGFSGFNVLHDDVGNSNADHAVFVPSIYTPDAPLGQRFSNEGMPNSSIARMYHSSVILTPQGNFLVAGSNPNNSTLIDNVKFPPELRVQMLNPPYMSVSRPKILDIPEKLGYGQNVTVPITLPKALNGSGAKVQGTRAVLLSWVPSSCVCVYHSRSHGPWLFHSWIPYGRASCLHGCHHCDRREVFDLRDASQWSGVPAGTGDCLPDCG